MALRFLSWWCSEVKDALTRKKRSNIFDMNTSVIRCLTAVDLTAIAVSGMTGAGIYVLSGVLSRNIAGPAIIISHLIGGIISMFNAMVYAELCCLYPKSGSLFTFAYISIGEASGFLLGWTILMEYTFGIAAVSRAFGGVIDSLTSHAISNATFKYIGPIYINSQESYPDFIAGLIILILGLITLSGIRVSTNVNIVLTVLNYILILIISITCLVYMQPQYYAPEDNGGFAPFGISGILQGASISFFVYIGFDAIALNSEEAKNPSKSVPIANVFSILITCSGAMFSSFCLNMIIPWSKTDITAPFTEAFMSRGVTWAAYIATIGIICAAIGNNFVHLVSSPKLLYSFSEDGLLCDAFSYLLPKTKVPVWSNLILTLFVMIIAIILPLQSLVEFVSIGCLICYTSTCLILLVFRYTDTVRDQSQDQSHHHESQEEMKPGELSVKHRNTSVIKQLMLLPSKSTPIIFCLLFTLFSFVINCFIKYGYRFLVQYEWWAVVLVVLLSLLAILCMLIPSFYHQSVPENSFKIPWVPFYPCLTIFLNCMLLVNVSSQTWIRYLIWLLCGAVIYFCYGMFHSKLREKNDDEKSLIMESNESSKKYFSIPETKEDKLN